MEFYVRRRDYNPALARWLSQDPIGYEDGQPGLYLYVSNEPVTLTDPSGLCANDIQDGFSVLMSTPSASPAAAPPPKLPPPAAFECSLDSVAPVKGPLTTTCPLPPPNDPNGPFRLTWDPTNGFQCLRCIDGNCSKKKASQTGAYYKCAVKEQQITVQICGQIEKIPKYDCECLLYSPLGKGKPPGKKKWWPFSF